MPVFVRLKKEGENGNRNSLLGPDAKAPERRNF
jgi:hypothetical protein